MGEETSENKNKAAKMGGGQQPFCLQFSPCNCCTELVRAMLKCLGFESEPQDGTSGQDSPAEGGTPSSAATDPPALETASARIGRRAPPTPPIGGGRGSQTNANPAT